MKTFQYCKMTIKIVRILNLILTLVFIFLGKYPFLTYIFINQILLEILNSNARYKLHPYKWYNTIFVCYELVLLERLRHFKMSPLAEWWLNNLEHICFALVIGFILYILLAIYWLKEDKQRLQRGLVVAIAFNAIGLINEWNQNREAGRPVFALIEDSVKDLKMNLIGTSILLIAIIARVIYKHYTQRLNP